MTLDAYCSNLNTRLIAAFDAIDAVRLGHKQELEDLQRRIHILHARCRALKHQVKFAEAERDELREGVERLIEKVEIANDYRVLPHASMHLSSPLEPIHVDDHLECQSLDQRLDASPLISMLVSQLAFIKDSHKQLKHSSDARIALLEAKLARRNLELESCRPCACSSSSSHEHGSQPKVVSNQFGASVELAKSLFTKIQAPPLNSSPPPLRFREESFKILDETTGRQRELQREVALLHKKLDYEKKLLSEAFSTPSSDPTSPGVTERRPILNPPDLRNRGVMLPLEPVEPQICPSGTDIKEFQAERDNIRNFMLATSDGDSEHLRNCLLLEEECIRLRKSEQELRQKLLLASTTEQDLKSSINRLQEELNAQKAQNDNIYQPNNDTFHTPATANINRIEIELDMARGEVDRRQLAIEEIRNQIHALLHPSAKDTG